MLATLSFRIMADVPLRTRCSLRVREPMPGNGSTFRLHTSASEASKRARSFREGVKIGILVFVVNSDCDRLIGGLVPGGGTSFTALVFLMMTWHRGDLGPTVVALWIETRRATVPGLPKTVPRLLMLSEIELCTADSDISSGSLES